MKGLELSFDTLISLLPLLTALVAAFEAYKIARNKDNMEIIKERYYKFVFPIFDLLEPHLYSKIINHDIIIKIENAINHDKNRAIAGRNLIYLIEQCKNKSDIRTYKRLCSLISYEHENLCRKLKIPKRGEYYKLKRKQYPDRFDYITNTHNQAPPLIIQDTPDLLCNRGCVRLRSSD